MNLSLIIVLSFFVVGLGLLILFTSVKHSSNQVTIRNEKAAPLLFTAPILSWLVYVKYNQIEASLFNTWPYAALIVMLVALALVLLNLKK